jgi:hypothetical protein
MRPIAIRRISFFETSVAKQVDRCDDHHYDEQRQQCVEYRVGKFMQPTPPWQLARLVCCLETVHLKPHLLQLRKHQRTKKKKGCRRSGRQPKGLDACSRRIESGGLGQQPFKPTQNYVLVAVPKHYLLASSGLRLLQL